jgi:hypothetical protein
MPYRGPGEAIAVPEDKQGNPDYLACASFIDCIRKNQRPEADERLAWETGIAVALGNQAIDQGQRIVLSQGTHTASQAAMAVSTSA